MFGPFDETDLEPDDSAMSEFDTNVEPTYGDYEDPGDNWFGDRGHQNPNPGGWTRYDPLKEEEYEDDLLEP